MTDRELADEIGAQKQLLVSVGTGGSRIEDVNAEYRARRARIRDELAVRGLEDPNPYVDLWNWHARWADGLPTWASRRAHIAGLYDPLLEAVERGDRVPIPPPAEPAVAFAIPAPILAGVCVVEGPTHSGTVFSIGFGMFVTCEHTTTGDRGEAIALELIRADRPTERHPARVLRAWADEDLAVLFCSTIEAPTLTVLASPIPEPGTRGLVIGFPDYAPGNSVQQVPVVTTGQRRIAGIEVAVVGGGIRVGMSGGPVVDQFGQVIGVAQRGGTSHDDAEREHHGFIPARRVRDLVTAIVEARDILRT